MAHMQTRRWETATRYYECRVYDDLFGQPVLMAVNGGKGSRLGMTRIVAAGQAQVDAVLGEIAAARSRRGYQERLIRTDGLSPGPDPVQASPIAQSKKRICHDQVRGARRKRRQVVIHD